jgi:uncharacterized protein GlcG (DUF336 family)
MSRTSKLLFVVAIGLAASNLSSAQGVVMLRNLSLGMAKTVAEAAIAECRSKGFHTSVAVVDRTGQLMVLLRDEQASPTTAEMARRKAYTSRAFGVPTTDFQQRTAGDTPAAAQRDVNDMLALSGGIPIKVGSETIGAVGSSGSSLEQDDACAKAGLAAVADQLRAAQAQ